jgi:hypothetical protein
MQNQLIDIEQIEKHYRIEPDGRILAIKSGRYLTNVRNLNGHLYVGLFKYRPNKMIAVASLVAEKYLGTAPPKAKINHKDFNIANNNITNLEYSTLSSIIIRSHFANKRVFSTR